MNVWKYRKRATKGKPELVDHMLTEYEIEAEHVNVKKPMWRIGYLCAMRDAGLLTWDQWADRIRSPRSELGNADER